MDKETRMNIIFDQFIENLINKIVDDKCPILDKNVEIYGLFEDCPRCSKTNDKEHIKSCWKVYLNQWFAFRFRAGMDKIK